MLCMVHVDTEAQGDAHLCQQERTWHPWCSEMLKCHSGKHKQGLGRAHKQGILPAAEAGGRDKADFPSLAALSHTHTSEESCKDLCSRGWPPPAQYGSSRSLSSSALNPGYV